MTTSGASSEDPIKVAIIGGGCAAMTTAFELSRPQHHGRYQVTVYQEGWRLGGKGASGRGPSGRIEEHGLHIWLGFYDNAFRMLRQCYGELLAADPASPYGDWRDAFTPEPEVGLFTPTEHGGWQKWAARFPPQPGLPGDPLEPGELLSLTRYMARAFSLFRLIVLDSQVTPGGPSSPTPPPTDPETLTAALGALMRLGVFSAAAVLVEALGVLSAAFASAPARLDGALLRLAEAVCAELRRWLEDRLLADDSHRHIWEIADLSLANVVGVLRLGLLTDPRGLDAIENYELREWLLMNGASERAVNSPMMRGLYDLAMAYEDGDPNRPSLSAGEGLRGTLRMFFGYRGALMWRMRSGMGDVVFAPLYEALRQRGVRFEFFHRLTNVGLPEGGEILPGDQSHVESLTFDVQARIVDGQAYAPLIEVAGRPCWPSYPLWDQLADGARMAAEGWNLESHWDRRRAGAKTLKVTRDFDFVVLGVGLGAIPHVCREILARDARWLRMTREVKTVASQAFQIWLHEDVEQLGWQGPPYIAAGFVKPYDTWCDMAHVIPEEAWEERPRTAVYFCSVMRDPPILPTDDDTGYPARRAATPRPSLKVLAGCCGQAHTARTAPFAGKSSPTPAWGRASLDRAGRSVSPHSTGAPTSIRRTVTPCIRRAARNIESRRWI
jgi:uncharacterized protein with NAD-binding domain and iron-sulfur cluster